MTSFVPPLLNGTRFTCPLCGTLAQQTWNELWAHSPYAAAEEVPLNRSHCLACYKYMYWYDNRIVVPLERSAPMPHPMMPPHVAGIYDEARRVFDESPRAAAALLRLTIQTLCAHLGQSDKSVNDAIAQLVKDGLPVRVQKALDTVRVVGNNAVHPGEISVNDSQEIAAALFPLTNFVVERMIAEPAKIDELFHGLPEGALKAIARRDGGPLSAPLLPSDASGTVDVEKHPRSEPGALA